MRPYGTIHPGVNGTHCNNQYPQMEPSNNTCLWGITAFSLTVRQSQRNNPILHVNGTKKHLANKTNKRCTLRSQPIIQIQFIITKQYQKCNQTISQSLVIFMHNQYHKVCTTFLNIITGQIQSGYWNSPQPPVSPLSAKAGDYPYLNRR